MSIYVFINYFLGEDESDDEDDENEQMEVADDEDDQEKDDETEKMETTEEENNGKSPENKFLKFGNQCFGFCLFQTYL